MDTGRRGHRLSANLAFSGNTCGLVLPPHVTSTPLVDSPPHYVAAADTQGFLLRQPDGLRAPAVKVILNWKEQLREQQTYAERATASVVSPGAARIHAGVSRRNVTRQFANGHQLRRGSCRPFSSHTFDRFVYTVVSKERPSGDSVRRRTLPVSSVAFR